MSYFEEQRSITVDNEHQQQQQQQRQQHHKIFKSANRKNWPIKLFSRPRKSMDEKQFLKYDQSVIHHNSSRLI